MLKQDLFFWALLPLLIFIGAWYLLLSGVNAVRNTKQRTEREESFRRNSVAYGLSARETEVARLLLEGRTYREVGDALFISEKTVDTHVQHIYAKTGARNRLSLLQKLYRFAV